MPELTRSINVEIQILSPVHTGSGEELMEGFDYLIPEGSDCTWFLKRERFFDAMLDRLAQSSDPAALAAAAEKLASKSPGEWLKDGFLDSSDFVADSPLFSYVLKGQPQQLHRIGEQIKDAFGRPYLPGSSLKGALRTAIGWQMLTERRQPGQPLDWSRLNPDSKNWAAHAFEVDLFAPSAPRPGDAPNYDLLRALRVSDTEPLPAAGLGLADVQIYPPKQSSAYGQQSLNLCQEVLLPGSTLRGSISVDTWLLRDPAAAPLGLGQLAGKLLTKNLAVAGRNMARSRIKDEIAYFKGRGQETLAQWYAQLSKDLERMPQQEPGMFLLQVGWGAGWDSKTFSRDLRKDEQIGKVVDRFFAPRDRRRQPEAASSTSRGSDAKGPGAPAEKPRPFPGSRHVALKNGKPHLPVGWIIVNLEDVPRRGGRP